MDAVATQLPTRVMTASATNVLSSSHHESTGTTAASSGVTKKIKQRQSDRLTEVKRRSLAVVVLADLVLLAALIYQMIWLNESLHGALDDRIVDLMGFYRNRYDEKFTDFTRGAHLYARNRTDDLGCRALSGVAGAQDQLQQVLAQEVRGRAIEVAIVTDTDGVIFGAAGHRAAVGQRFNPHNVVTDLYDRHPQAAQTLRASVMIDRGLLTLLKAPVLGVASGPGPARPLPTWHDQAETLARLVVTPLLCATSHVRGYVILGDVLTARKYDRLNRLATATENAMMAVMARGPSQDGTWRTQTSYNNPGHGWSELFPDVAAHLTDAELRDVYRQGRVRTGQIMFGGIGYTYGMVPIGGPQLGSQWTDAVSATEAVILHAEPNYHIAKTRNTALLWHVPFGVFMAVLSLVTLKYTFVKFVQPMKQLIDSVKMKRLKEFNERIRQMQQSRGTLWTFLVKTVVVQGILLALIFVNHSLLASTIGEFTSATTQGRVAPFLCSTLIRQIAAYLNALSGEDAVISAALTGNLTVAVRADIQTAFRTVDSEAVYLLGRDSVVIGSSHGPAEGLTFPEVGIMSYLRNRTGAALKQFTTVTNWHADNVNQMTPRAWSVTDPPALVRIAVAPVSLLQYNADGAAVAERVVGALVVARIFNGRNSVWANIVDAFGSGYYGLYEWDRDRLRFAVVMSQLQTESGADNGVDFAELHPDVLDRGLRTAYVPNGIHIEEGVDLRGHSSTVTVLPYFSLADDVVLSPLMLNAYQVTGVAQDRYNRLLAQQTTLQAAIMAVECLASLLALAFTYWPMKSFLDNVERAFNVPSMSADKRHKMEEKAAAMIESAAMAEPPTRPAHSAAGVHVHASASVHGSRTGPGRIPMI